MVLELNEYVRTKDGIIAKVIGVQSGGIEKYYFDKKIIDNFKELTQIGTENVVLKHSFNIIDLIEEGDVLLLFDKEYEEEYKVEVFEDTNNIKIFCNFECTDFLGLEDELLSPKNIKLLSIGTKEQFKAMEYEVK